MPASTLNIDSTRGCLTGIKVYSQLGVHAGISGIQFIYDSGLGILWGCADDAASLAFFLVEAERLEKIITYKIYSTVYHIEVSFLLLLLLYRRVDISVCYELP